MDHLSKQQLILLALLVSFVTSLATGIFTVSLMSQAPKGVMQTINQVVEKTIQVAGSPSARFGTVAIKVEDQIASAVSSVSPSVIKLGTKYTTDNIIGNGLVVSKDGTIMTDASLLPQIGNEASGILPDGTRIMFSLISTDPDNGVIFLRPETSDPSLFAFTPVTFGKNIQLGQTLLSLSTTFSQTLAQGIVTKVIIPPSATSTNASSGIVSMTITKDKVIPGSPLFDPGGDVVGIYLSILSPTNEAAFYPISVLQSVIPQWR